LNKVDWQLPVGVDRSLWEYAHDRSIARDYDRFFDNNLLFEFDRQWLDARLEKPGRLVDLGCGAGRHVVHFARRGFQVLGVDLSHEMLLVTGEKARGQGVDVDRLEANLCRLDCLRDRAFDYAISMFSTLGMVEGHENRLRVLLHARRLLRPGGLLALHVHNRCYNLWDPQGRRWLAGDLLTGLLGRRPMGDKRLSYRGIPRMYLHVFTRGELSRLLTDSGFRVRELLPLRDDRCGPLPARHWLPRLRANGFLVLAEAG